MAVLRFGVFELDADAGELRRQGRRVHLAAQPFKVLAVLTGRPGEIVTRDELRRLLWNHGTFVEFDRGINFSIAEVRAALHDEARSPRFIETVPKRGYRFIADVHAAAAVEPRASKPEAPAASRTRRWVIAAALALTCVQQPTRVLVHTRATALADARAAFDRGTAIGPENADRRRGIAALRQAVRIDPRFA